MPRFGPVKRLTSLKIREVSSVDRGAGENVRVVLFKRDFTPEERDRLAGGAAMSDGSFPVQNVADLKNAIRAVGRASDPEAARAHIIRRARALGATDELPDDWVNKAMESAFASCELTVGEDGHISHEEAIDKALADALPANVQNRVRDAVDVFCKSCSEIIADKAEDRPALLNKSLGEFVEALGKLAPAGAEKAVAATVLAALKAEEVDMDPKELEALQKKAADAEKLQKQLDDTNAKVAKLMEEVAFGKLNDQERAYCDKLSGEDKAKFVAMDGDKRKAEMAKAAERDADSPVLKAMQTELKKAQDEAAALKKRLDEREADETKKSFAKRAVDVYGQPEAFGETLQKAFNGDAAAQTEVDKVATALRRQAETGGMFKQFGHGRPAEGSAEAIAEARAKDLQKADSKLSREQALAKVYEGDAELYSRIRAEETRKAA
jgi:hypothetical protein